MGHFAPMTIPTNTAFYAGLLALFYIYLALNVVKLRRAYKVGIGSSQNDDHEKLNLAIRVHGNFSEYIPLGLIMLMLLEMISLDWIFIHALGGGLLLGRILHCLGLGKTRGASYERIAGSALTFLSFILMGLTLIVKSLLAA